VIGNKARNLLRLRDEFNLYVPDFIVVPFDDVIAHKKESLIFNNEALDTLHHTLLQKDWKKVSFRTSAQSEDGARASFAGQYQSFVDKTYSKAALKKYIIACYESTKSATVQQYAKLHGATVEPGGSVIIQKMFYGTTSGVLFSENGTGHMHVVYSDSWKNVVVDNESAQEVFIPKNAIADGMAPPFMRTLAKHASMLERAYGNPVDIEWSYDGTTLAFLQVRPQTTLHLEYSMTWDSTNISENYPGVTLPLTYSFIRTVYATVYPEFLQLIGVSKNKLNQHHAVFSNMLGYLNGRVFYRISNWYHVVDLIPGRQNRLFFESMLNPVKKNTQATQKRVLDPGSIIAIIRFLAILSQSQRLSRQFQKQFAKRYESLQQATPDGVNAETIYTNIQHTKQRVLELWAVPVLNDVRVMIFHGLLKKRLLKKHSHAVYLQYLQGLTDRASIQPLKELGALGDTLRSIVPGARTVTALKKSSEWHRCVEETIAFTKNYAARTPDELKLESVRLSDTPEAIMALALHSNRTSYDQRSRETNPLPPLDGVSRYIARQARQAIDWRERFRFNRAQVFRLASDAYLAIGDRFASEGIIKISRDIYYLTEQEIETIINGHAWKYDALELVRQRKREARQYETASVSLRVTGTGVVAPKHLKNDEKKSGAVTVGMGVSAGSVSAEVIVVKAFDPNLSVAGKILIVTHIDPGWTLLFTQAAGVITERGNALSHVAIVARELHIPAIVGIPQATTHYTTGDFVTMDGMSGEILRVNNKKARS